MGGNKLTGALMFCNMALRLPGNKTFVYIERASVYQDLKQWDMAKADLFKALEIEPDNNVAKLKLKCLITK